MLLHLKKKKQYSHQDQKVNIDAKLSANWFNTLGHHFGPYSSLPIVPIMFINI